jgi:hypothetical protein
LTIDRERLKKIVEQELKKLRMEVNPAHNEDGTFAKKGSGKTYSLTKNALDDVADDTELEVPARGSITSKGKVSSKFGMNSGSPDKQCGRLTIDGDGKKKTRSCKDYPKNYWGEELELKEKESTEGRKKQKKETEKRNRFKNRNDLVPRSEDSPSIRRDKLFGDAELYSLARGIAEELADDEDERGFPRWNEQGKLVSSVELDEMLENHDLIYIKELIKKNVASALKQTRAQAQKQGVGCSWASIMRALADIERAQNPPKK